MYRPRMQSGMPSRIGSQYRSSMTIEGTPADSQLEYDLFISHASEDKESFVRELATELRKSGLRVWYDEFSLRVGDSLRESMDRGLRSSRFGLVVISPAFFEKRWTARELSGLAALEMSDGVSRILPVWLGVTHKDVATESPMLADLVALKAEDGLAAVVEAILLRVKDAPRSYLVHHEGATVDVVAIARLEGGRIVGHSFKNCLLYGPAVLANAHSNVLTNQHFDVGQLWPLEVGRPYLGQIDLIESRIENCTFDRVGFAFTPKFFEQFPIPTARGKDAFLPSVPNMSMYHED